MQLLVEITFILRPKGNSASFESLHWIYLASLLALEKGEGGFKMP